jgi:hypothetical protein
MVANAAPAPPTPAQTPAQVAQAEHPAAPAREPALVADVASGPGGRLRIGLDAISDPYVRWSLPYAVALQPGPETGIPVE